jgi:malonate decarboxylase gamma subunit
MNGAVRSRGRVWFDRLAADAVLVDGLPPSVLAADGSVEGLVVRWVCVVPNPESRFMRARSGEVGIDEGFGIAAAVDNAPNGSAIVAIVDVPGQAFGLKEEEIGLQHALAAAVDAYIRARRRGRPIAALLVGKAISGAFLAHGMQAGWIGALNDPGVEVHVMSEAAVARVTRMKREDIAELAREIPATARDIESFNGFGAIDRLFDVADAANPLPEELAGVTVSLAAALRDPRLALRNPIVRLEHPNALRTRALARRVRELLAEQWDA